MEDKRAGKDILLQGETQKAIAQKIGVSEVTVGVG